MTTTTPDPEPDQPDEAPHTGSASGNVQTDTGSEAQ
jgi:hypothetical protein